MATYYPGVIGAVDRPLTGTPPVITPPPLFASVSFPAAVVPAQADTTCCIAASYEAKALRIKTGTQVGEAKRICPEIVLIEGSHGVYADYSHRIAQAVERCCPVAHTPSIDEMVCELMGR